MVTQGHSADLAVNLEHEAEDEHSAEILQDLEQELTERAIESFEGLVDLAIAGVGPLSA